MLAALAFSCTTAEPRRAVDTAAAPNTTPAPYALDPDALDSRVELQRAAIPATELVQKFDSDFGSPWFDRDNAIVVPTLPTATDDEKAQIVEAAPPGAVVRFVPAEYSARQLRAWSDQLAVQWMAFTNAQRDQAALPSDNVFTDLAALNLEVSSLGPQDDVNRLRIGLVSLPEDGTEAVRQAWRRAADAGYAPPLDAVIFEAIGRPVTTG